MLAYLLYILTGIFAGLLAGLFGIGGGIIVIPILDFIFTHFHFPHELVMHMAVGTSLAIMIFTASSAALAFSRRGLILWNVFYKFLPGLILGTMLGSFIVKEFSSESLRIIFGTFLVLLAINMFFVGGVNPRRKLPGFVLLSLCSFIIGMISGFFGIGGGSLIVPFFIYCNVEMHKATGTSAICGIPLGIVGASTMIVTGWHDAILYTAPPGTTGFVYWPAVLFIALASIFFAPLGARFAAVLPSKILKRLFAIVIFITGIHLIL